MKWDFLLYSGEWHSLWVKLSAVFLFIDTVRNSHGSMISQNQKLFCYTFYLETHMFIWTEQYEVQQLFQSGLVNLLMLYFDTTIKCTNTTNDFFFFFFYLVTYTLQCLTVLADFSLNYNCEFCLQWTSPITVVGSALFSACDIPLQVGFTWFIWWCGLKPAHKHTFYPVVTRSKQRKTTCTGLNYMFSSVL